jgi:hypothetical protein
LSDVVLIAYDFGIPLIIVVVILLLIVANGFIFYVWADWDVN